MTRTALHHPADDCVPDATDHMEALGYEPTVSDWDFDDVDGSDGLLDSAIEFMDALMGADMSYAVPITDEHLTVRDVVEPEQWDATIVAFKRRRDELRGNA